MLLLNRFSEIIPIIAIGEFLAATSCSLLQQPSTLSPAPHLPPNSQVPSPGGPEAVLDAPWYPSVRCPNKSVTTLNIYMPSTIDQGIRLSVVLYSAAD